MQMKARMGKSRCRCAFSRIVLVAVLVGFGGCRASGPVTEKRYLVAPTVLPGVRSEMKTAGFWIGQLAQPDEVILDVDGIRALNRDIRDRLKLTKDIATFPERYNGDELRAALQRELDGFRTATRYGADGRALTSSYYASIEAVMDQAMIDTVVDVGFGFVVDNADQRLLPTAAGLYAQAGDIDFDEVQNNALDIGTPVAIVHTSADDRWFYTMGPSSDGWIAAEQIALCSHEQLRDVVTRPFVTVIRAKGNVYLDEDRTLYYGFVRMGARFALAGAVAGDTVAVQLPTRRADGDLEIRTGYLSRREVCEGHLAYTRRHIIEQAFEMLNAPYGWGGANGQQDCSQFVQEVFATVGIDLPRNSSEQAQVGELIRRFADEADDARRQAVATEAIPGASLLHLRGHVMLYLGPVEQRPYVMHAAWAYREGGEGGDTMRVLNRVVVTDLDLGQGSRVGSLLERLASIRVIRLPPR